MIWAFETFSKRRNHPNEKMGHLFFINICGKFLKQLNKFGCKSVSTTHDVHEKLLKEYGEKKFDATLYRDL